MSDPFIPRIFGMPDSGNCYKPCLLMDLLGRPYEWRPVDALGGETQGASFLAINPAGRVPVLEYAPGSFLAESNAILWFLGQDSPLWPDGAALRAAVLAWMFFEQNSHEVWIATSRFRLMFAGVRPDAEEILRRREPGMKALALMEHHLGDNDWFGAPGVSLADVALFAYTHVADEGGFPLEEFPRIRAWLSRVAGLPGFRPMRRGGDARG
jgi:glutathione S-transferase